MVASARLREATALAHEKLERTRFARAVVEARVTRQEYVDYLRALSIVIATLHHELGQGRPGTTPMLLDTSQRWRKLLASDLESLTSPTSATNRDSTRAALALAAHVRLGANRAAAELLGIAYVLVGSHNGNLVVAPKVTRALGLGPGVGTSYLTASAGRGEWPELKAYLDSQLSDSEHVERATRAAESTFAGFESILEALAPGAPLVHHPTTMNPEAGDHPVVDDDALLDLARGIADRVHAEYPYLELRFGERGRRFAHSDAAWLLGLCPLAPVLASAQVAWLEGILSARGIPSICLERKLHLAYEAFSSEDTRVEGAATLGECADRIRKRREALASRIQLGELRTIDLAPLGKGAQELLACAVVDQHTGIAPCADNIRNWIAGQDALPATTVSAVLGFLDTVALRVRA